MSETWTVASVAPQATRERRAFKDALSISAIHVSASIAPQLAKDPVDHPPNLPSAALTLDIRGCKIKIDIKGIGGDCEAYTITQRGKLSLSRSRV